MSDVRKLTLEEWKAEGTKLFGTADHHKWKFKCVSCGNVQSYEDFVGLVEDPNDVFFFSCLSRWKKDVGCNWTLGGLFRIHKLEVQNMEGKYTPVFEFAEPEGGK